MTTPYDSEAIDILARTLYGEARGELSALDGGLTPLIAVGNVIRNRLQRQSWFGKTIVEICQKPYQFSCWNKDDSNYEAVLQAHTDLPIFKTCLEVAHGILYYNWPDITRNADHYYATHHRAPPWSIGQTPVFQIRRHLFFKLHTL